MQPEVVAFGPARDSALGVHHVCPHDLSNANRRIGDCANPWAYDDYAVSASKLYSLPDHGMQHEAPFKEIMRLIQGLRIWDAM